MGLVFFTKLIFFSFKTFYWVILVIQLYAHVNTKTTSYMVLHLHLSTKLQGCQILYLLQFLYTINIVKELVHQIVLPKYKGCQYIYVVFQTVCTTNSLSCIFGAFFLNQRLCNVSILPTNIATLEKVKWSWVILMSCECNALWLFEHMTPAAIDFCI